MTISAAGDKFKPGDHWVYFLATNPDVGVQASDVHDHLLVAVNELGGQTNMERFRWFMDQGKSVLIDSGIFWLTNEHKKRHNITMDEALGLAPEEIDGFDALFNRYVAIVQKYGSQSWGYIELDQGGRENKIRTRAKLEAMGLRPIPVYHPFNDGWDYFDYLAERYDRICVGNVVQADPPTRKRLVATAWDRHRKYPDLWIHLLGLTPSELLYALPINSGDSSTWLAPVRWTDQEARAAGKVVGRLPYEFRYQIGAEAASPTGHHQARRMSAYGAAMDQRNWRNHLRRMEEIGVDVYPKP